MQNEIAKTEKAVHLNAQKPDIMVNSLFKYSTTEAAAEKANTFLGQRFRKG